MDVGVLVDCVGASKASRPTPFLPGGLGRFAFYEACIPRGDVSGRLCDPRAPRAWAAPPLPLLTLIHLGRWLDIDLTLTLLLRPEKGRAEGEGLRGWRTERE